MTAAQGRLSRFKALLEEFYVSPYRGALARALARIRTPLRAHLRTLSRARASSMYTNI